MILNDIEIRKRCNDYKDYQMEKPLISPFEEKRLQGASYDLTIGEEFIFYENSLNVVDLKDSTCMQLLYKKARIGNEGFLLMPSQYVLTTLNEILYVPKELTAHLRPKTRFIRLGLLMSGQHINPESICKLNIGMYNLTQNPIRIYPNISIAQIVFEEMINPPSQDKLYSSKKDANYSADIEFVGAKIKDEFELMIDKGVDALLNLED